MLKNISFLLAALLSSFPKMQARAEVLTFPSLDGVMITADWYHVSDSAETIVLCHQAGWSRGEYVETAIWLNELGYNCAAIDQRSGESVNGVVNETAKRAKADGKGQNYLDAEQDICAAVDYFQKLTAKDVILVGSSYSASLALKIAAEHGGISAVAAFSPGEYFGTAMRLSEKIKDLAVPAFITCSPSEVAKTRSLVDKIKGQKPSFFEPKIAGEHGSRALWESKKGHEGYREAFSTWLKSL